MPYNPGVQDISGQLYAQGLVGAANSLSNSFVQAQRLKEQDQKFLSQSKATESLLKSYLPKEKADEMLRIDPKETPEARHARLTGTVENFVLETKLKQFQQSQAARERANFKAQQLAQFAAGGGRGILAPEAQAALRNQLSTPAGQLTAQTYDFTGEAPSGGDITEVIKADMNNNARVAAAEAKAANGSLPQKYRNVSPLQKNGKFLGWGVFDESTGLTGLHNPKTGELDAVPEGAEPITATGLQKSVPDNSTFRKYKSDLTQSEVSLDAMDRYFKNVGGSRQGLDLLADKMSTGFKTLFDGGKLKPEELAQAASSGQMQGLLGKFRTTILSPGPLTEPDAERIIMALGGDANALRNKEVVRKAITSIYADRYKQYEDDLNFYNAGVGDYWGERGFKKIDKKEFSHNFVNPDEPAAASVSAPKGVSAAEWAAMSPEDKALWQTK